MGLKSLVNRAKEIKYTPKDCKTDWDYIHESIWISLHNDIQCETLFILSNMFIPIKFLAKLLIQNFIEKNLT